ncbi:MAG TPA: AAA family ATPase [Gemmatimonadales bacterium]|jgi:energy-coupling factor transporter ATP-binding protein EcfA2
MATITRLSVRNFKMLREFDLELDSTLNILVGKNDSGKSTILEAVNLALTGRLNGRPFAQELSPYLVNSGAVADYVAALKTNPKATPPEVIIEVEFADDDSTAFLRGMNNLRGADACGIRICASMSVAFIDEYSRLVASPGEVRLAPTEYYTVDWLGFNGNAIGSRSVPVRVSLIDASAIRAQSGIDQHLQQAVQAFLDPAERVELSREYRSLREQFSEKAPVRAINEKLQATSSGVSDRALTMALDLSQRSTWETSIVAHLDEIPFALIGKGEQNVLKILFALVQRAATSNVVLIEEPEAHLSFALLNVLMRRIGDNAGAKQLIASTHSTFIANKLGLEHLVCLGGSHPTRLHALEDGTVQFFRRLPGYDTLRLVLASGALLVEGPSDELVVQRAYLDKHGKLPLENGIDVISVGLSHKRFLELAIPLQRRVWVITDNDGKTLSEVGRRFEGYLNTHITLHTCDDPALRTLEPAIVAANSLGDLNAVLSCDFSTKEEALEYMSENKTEGALAIFAAEASLVMPAYIASAIA